MTIELFEEIFKTELTNFKGDHCFKGLQILAKYSEDVVISVRKGMIYSVHVDDLIKAGITEEDARELSRLYWDIENGYLMTYV